jgi:hypothetical protein
MAAITTAGRVSSSSTEDRRTRKGLAPLPPLTSQRKLEPILHLARADEWVPACAGKSEYADRPPGHPSPAWGGRRAWLGDQPSLSKPGWGAHKDKPVRGVRRNLPPPSAASSLPSPHGGGMTVPSSPARSRHPLPRSGGGGAEGDGGGCPCTAPSAALPSESWDPFLTLCERMNGSLLAQGSQRLRAVQCSHAAPPTACHPREGGDPTRTLCQPICGSPPARG